MPQPFTSLNDAFGDVGSAQPRHDEQRRKAELERDAEEPEERKQAQPATLSKRPNLGRRSTRRLCLPQEKKKKLIVIFTDNAELIRANLLNMRKFELL